MTAPRPFVSIRTEGGLLPSELLGRVAALDATLEALSADGYNLPSGERLREGITRSWQRLEGPWAAFRTSLDAAAEDGATRRWLLAMFAELGYGRLQPAPMIDLGGRAYPLTHLWGHVPVHLVPAQASLERRTAGVAGAAQRSPHAIAQELLNRSDGYLWGFVSNGRQLRLLRDNAALTRQAFVEFDLEAMFDSGEYADFAVLWLVCHESRLEGDPPEKCVLERWSAEAARTGARALDHLRNGVEAAIAELGGGFLAHRDNGALRAALRVGELDKRDYYRELLRLVYRLLFVLVAEARDLLINPAADPTGAARYRDWYSLSRLTGLAETSRGGPHPDLWRQLRVVFAALGSPTGAPALGLPGLGSFLWSDRATPHLEDAELANAALLAAIRALTWLRDEKEKVVRPVDYRNLGSEELGSVYESLLELHPSLDPVTGEFELLTAAGNERKTTGSYYTPSSLISELLDSALEPVLDDRLKEAGADPAAREAALLSVTVLDPACGSGHFLIAAAQRIAHRLASVRSGEDAPSPEDTRAALRDVVGRCVYGVDVNEMAVELCKVSLWMEAVEPGKPLSFLDSKIVHGNSLLGTTPRLLAAGIPDEAFKPIGDDDKKTVTELRKTNKRQREAARSGQKVFDVGPSVGELQAPIRQALARIEALPADTPDQVVEKERRFQEFQHAQAAVRARLAADTWCAAFVAPRLPGAPAFTHATVRRIIEGHALEPELMQTIENLKDQYKFLHFHLAFPQIFHVPNELDADGDGPGWDGGFDVVLGNPPWEKVKLSEKEFFALRAPEIAALAGAKRKAAIAALADSTQDLWADFHTASRQAESESHFLRQSGRYPLCGLGDVNTYAVFAENMRDAIDPRGRVGVIVPTGIAMDDTTKTFFRTLVDGRSLVCLYDFKNHDRLFYDVGHRRFHFCLLVMAKTEVGLARFAFYAHNASDVRDPDFTFVLTAEDLALINPTTRTAPIFRSRRDAELTKDIYRRCPVFMGDGEDGNLWGVEMWNMFHPTNDSHLFRTAAELEAQSATLLGNTWIRGEKRWLPLYEAKMFHHFTHRWGDYAMKPSGSESTILPFISDDQLASPSYVVQPRYWVAEEDVRNAMRDRTASWRVGFRDICRNADERTMISAVLPAAAYGNHPLLHVSDPRSALLLVAMLSSLVQDYCARQKVGGTHMTFFTLRQLPALSPVVLERPYAWSSGSASEWILPRALELAYTAWDLEPLGRGLGFCTPPFRWNRSRRELLRAELDAAFFHLYEIEHEEVDYIMETFPIVRRKDEAAHGEFRTKRLILERYEAMAEAIAIGKPYETPLHPLPADPSCAHPESTRPSWARP
jgi:hypothetical protein